MHKVIALGRIGMQAAAVICGLLAGCGGKQRADRAGNGDTSPGGEVVLFAAASTVNACDRLIAEFSKQSSAKVSASYGSSGTLANQIVNGAPADLFLSANPKWTEVVGKARLIARQSKLLSGRLVLVVPRDNSAGVKSLSDLATATVTHVALADPETSPAGAYARQALRKLELWDAVEKKVVASATVRQSLLLVGRGEAAAGIVYLTDAKSDPNVESVYTFDPQLHEAISYPLALLARGGQKAAAREFYDYLHSEAAAEIFRGFGFTVLDAAERPEP